LVAWFPSRLQPGLALRYAVAMKRHRHVLFLIAASIASLVLYAVWQWHALPGHRITRVGYKQITAGMTQSEVEAILGVPPGDYAGGKARHPTLELPPGEGSPLWRREDWRSNEASIAVFFDPDGVVVNKVGTWWASEASWSDRVLQWMGW